jgi:hypothetical protein
MTVVERAGFAGARNGLHAIAWLLSIGLLVFAPLAAPVDAATGAPDGQGATEADAHAGLPGKLDLVEFQSSPFPFRGDNPGLNRPFLDVNSNNRLGHTSVRGGVYWEDETYSDRRSLLFIPTGFSLRRPSLMIVFFHGNQSTLQRDVNDRQRVPAQIAASGLNAVLVAPQFAVDALDSSPGHFWEAGAFRRYLDEAATRLAELYGDESARASFARMPVVLVAYSGGYLPAAWSIATGGADERLVGLILLDAVYGEVDKFADWIARRAATGFFFSAYSNSSGDANAALQAILARRGVSFTLGIPDHLARGSVSFVKVDDGIGHNDFVSAAWTKDPLSSVLSKVPGFEELRSNAVVASKTSDRPGAVTLDAASPRTAGAKSERIAGAPERKALAATEEAGPASPQGGAAAALTRNEQPAEWTSVVGRYLVGIGATGFVLTLLFASFAGIFARRRRWR